MMKWFGFMGVVVLFIASCSDVEPEPDRSHSKTFIWTVPSLGHNSSLTEYELKYSSDSTFPMNNWVEVFNEPYPGITGTKDSCTVDLPDGIWYGRIRAINRHGLVAEWSNTAIKDICSETPGKINDLE
jgi:hypothetical protein